MEFIFPGQQDNINNLNTKNNSFAEEQEPLTRQTIIKVIGVGGGGTNAVNRMREANVRGVQFIAVNTDNSSLRKSGADSRISLGTGLGVGGDPEKGQLYAEKDIDKLKDHIKGADMLFITTGMGGGTGTGAAPVIAKAAKELNEDLKAIKSKKEEDNKDNKDTLIVGIVTKPFSVEGSQRIENANKGIAKLREYTDALIVIPNDKLLMVDSKTDLLRSFKMIDDVLRRAIESITDTITKTGEINIDFSDVKTVLKNSDNAIIALGEGQTLNEAFKNAIENKFVEGDNITNADDLLVNVSYSTQNVPTVEDQAMLFKSIGENFKNYSYYKPGFVINDELDTRFKVSIIASFKKQTKVKEEDLVDQMEKIEEKKVEQKELFAKEAFEDDNPFSKPAWQTHKPRRL